MYGDLVPWLKAILALSLPLSILLLALTVRGAEEETLEEWRQTW